MNHYIELFKEKLAKYKVTQKQLADAAKRSPNNISEILNGKVSPTLDSFTLLIDTCDVLRPGFKEEYLRSLAGNKLDLQQFVYSLNSVEFGMLLMIAGQRVQDKKSQPIAGGYAAALQVAS